MTEWLKRSWVEIDLDALQNNLRAIKELLPSGVELAAVVKADAYGHGSRAAATAFKRAGADRFCVSNFNEALVLRDEGIEEPILILGYTPPEYAEWLAKLSITQTVVDSAYAEALSDEAKSAGVTVDVHIALDTGMGRIGLNARDLEATAREITEICALPGLYVCGLFTHFAVADAESEFGTSYTVAQRDLFVAVAGRLAQLGERFSTLHVSNSAATMFFPEFHQNMVRAGIALYGLSPTGKPLENIELTPAMTLKSSVIMVKKLRAGESVSYGCTYTAQKNMTIATLGLGYADGYPRALSNRGRAFIGGKVVPVIGTVCMDQLMLDVSDVPDIKVGDEAVFFGPGSPISADDVANLCGTINYEIVCGISRRIPRVYRKNGQIIDVVDYTIPAVDKKPRRRRPKEEETKEIPAVKKRKV